MCSGTGFGFSPPFLAGADGVCGWACVLACTPQLLAGDLGRAWLCACNACNPPLLAGVCCVSLCAWLGLLLHPATPGRGVGGCACLCARSLCTPALLVGCAVWVWVRPATPGWRFGVCVCLCARSACTPPLLAGVCGVGVCAWARVCAAPRQSWLAFSGVCVFVCALRLYPATPGWSVRCGCVCLGSGFGCAPPLLAGVLGCVCVCVRALNSPLPLTAGGAVRGCVLWLGLQLRPATPGWVVGVFVCLCAPSACTPPVLAGVCDVGVCAWVRLSAVPCHSSLGSWGVCVFVCLLRLYPATPGRVVCVCVGLDFACTPLFAALGVGARGLLRAPRPLPGTFWWGCLLGEDVRELSWVGFVTPPHLLFFFLFGLRGGVLFLALSCHGFVVSAPACQGLGSLCLRPPFPSRLGCAYVFFVWPPLLQWGVCRRVRGVLSSSGPLLTAGCRQFWHNGPRVFFRGGPWVPPLVVPCFAVLSPAGLCCVVVRSALSCRVAPCGAVVRRAMPTCALSCCAEGAVTKRQKAGMSTHGYR